MLLERWQTPQAIFRASASELEASGPSGAVARSVASACSFEDAAAQQQQLREAGAQLITLADARYPDPLRRIFDPPPVLFARGRVDFFPRSASAWSARVIPLPMDIAAAERLSGDLARAGMTIVSGMARGIDTAAHSPALAAGGLPSPSSVAASMWSIPPKTGNWPRKSPSKA